MDLSDFEKREELSGFLFSHPTHFRVDYSNNPYTEEDADVSNAKKNWNDCVRSIRHHAYVETVDYDTFDVLDVPPSQMSDAVFAANQAMPVSGQDEFILSNMQHEVREYEPLYFRQWAEHNGYHIREIGDDVVFEGQGDAKWHPKRELVWIGYGQRTERSAVDRIRGMVDATVIQLKLLSPKFYHLDVCFNPLSQDEVLVIPQAFSDDSYARIDDVFGEVYHVPESDIDTLGGNCTRVAPNTVAIDGVNEDTVELLESIGYEVLEVNTSAFRKSGGSVDCLFLSLP